MPPPRPGPWKPPLARPRSNGKGNCSRSAARSGHVRAQGGAESLFGGDFEVVAQNRLGDFKLASQMQFDNFLCQCLAEGSIALCPRSDRQFESRVSTIELLAQFGGKPVTPITQ